MHRFVKVVLVNPPSPPGYVANRDSMGGYGQLYPPGATLLPPLDLPYLAAYLLHKDVPIEVFEAQGLDWSLEHLVQQVGDIARQNDPERTLVVVRTALITLDWDLGVCAALKAASSSLAVAMYGSVVPHVMKRVRAESGLDYIVHGEPDQTVEELVNGLPESEILGLAYRQGGEWVQGAPRPFMKDLDQLPFPKWELLPRHRYTLPRSSATAAVPFLPMLTSRGCPFGCHYCPYPVGQGLPFRYRSPQNVVDEIQHLVQNLGIQYILFRDPMFSLRQNRVVEICDEIVRRGLKFRWKCETRPDCLNEETVRAMAAAGCEGINFGIESADVAIQANVGRKPITQEQIVKIVDLCRDLHIKTFCFFIIGLPGDTLRTILDTIDFAIRLRPNWIQFTAASPLVGTKLRDWAIGHGLVVEDEYAYRSSHETMMGNESLTKDQIAALHRFTLFLERYLINRGGVLKDANRTGRMYTAVRRLADTVGHASARMAFTVARNRFERSTIPAT